MAANSRQFDPPPDSLERQFPHLYAQLLDIKERAENFFRDVCDIEFTIQDGRLFVLNIRTAKRTPQANLRFLLQFFSERKISISDVLSRVTLADVEEFTKPKNLKSEVFAVIGAWPPWLCDCGNGGNRPEQFRRVPASRNGHQVVLVKNEINPADLDAVRLSQGVLTSRWHDVACCDGLPGMGEALRNRLRRNANQTGKGVSERRGNLRPERG